MFCFYNQTVFQKCECSFFDQVAIDAKSVPTFEKCYLVAELKLTMLQNGRFFMFSISALPPEGAFQMSTHNIPLNFDTASCSSKLFAQWYPR